MATGKQQPPRAWSARHAVRDAVSEADNVAFPRPKRYRRLVTPRRLSFDSNPTQLQELFGYLAQIRGHVERGARPLLLDLRRCEHIDPVGAMLLAAEVEHFVRIRPNRISGWEPHSRIVQATLVASGFYRAIGWERPDDAPRFPGMARITSGTGSGPSIPAKLGEVAELVDETWANPAFGNRVHGALNEALTNVIMHAYAPDLVERPVPVTAQRWWAAGFGNPSNNEAWFIVLDHGVGIPASAPARHRDLKAFFVAATKRPDHEIINLLVSDDQRSRTGLSQHGRGIPAMVDLIKERVTSGVIWIVSGSGVFLYGKVREGVELTQHFGMDASYQGTLILWKLGAPMPNREPTNER